MNVGTLIYFITYIIVYSFAGWILESVYKTIYEKKFVNSGFLTGPFCPIYGFGALIMLLTLNFLKERPILLFVVAFFVLSIWEYLVALCLEKIFKTKYWDYSLNKFNIHGRICLKNSIYWGILGVLFICYIHPFVDSYIKLIPTNILIYVSSIIGITMIVDFLVNAKSVIKFESMVTKINELGEIIKEKARELNEQSRVKIGALERESSENIEAIIQDLKVRQAKLKIRIYKQANRLKNAFPSMKSETITNFLNQRIDLNKLKKNIKKKNKE